MLCVRQRSRSMPKQPLPWTLVLGKPRDRGDGGHAATVAGGVTLREPVSTATADQLAPASTSRSRAAKASGSPVSPNSPPRNPPWLLGRTVSSMPSRSASASVARQVMVPLLWMPAASTTRLGTARNAATSGS